MEIEVLLNQIFYHQEELNRLNLLVNETMVNNDKIGECYLYAPDKICGETAFVVMKIIEQKRYNYSTEEFYIAESIKFDNNSCNIISEYPISNLDEYSEISLELFENIKSTYTLSTNLCYYSSKGMIEKFYE